MKSARFSFYTSLLMFFILGIPMLLATSQKNHERSLGDLSPAIIDDDNNNDRNDINDNEDVLIFGSTTWNGTPVNDRILLFYFLFYGQINYEMLPWVRHRPLAIRVFFDADGDVVSSEVLEEI
uniref:Uncharacterized protein n=1 Tax=Onchocerca volvulus TaxID=6282 RepID=A0A2K6VMG8_ONCVO